MGVSSSKSKTKNDPWAPAQPYILKGMQQTSDVFDQNQPQLQKMSQTAQAAFDRLAPGAFGTNPLVSGAQSSLGSIYTGGYLGKAPGTATYDKLQSAGANDPSINLLTQMAQSGVNGDTSQYYKDVIGGKYLQNNPYIDNIAQQATDAATKAQNQRFALSGMDAGMSTPYSTALGGAVADANNQVRYQNYNAERQLQNTAAGQSDSEYNTTQGRNLQAAQGLGAQYNADNATALNAANANDTNYNTGITQMLQASSLVPSLRAADYAGVSPMLSLLNTAADIPYVGTAALNGQIRQASNGYGTTTTTSNPGLLGSLDQLSQIGSNLGSAYKNFSDRRLKTGINKVGDSIKVGDKWVSYSRMDPLSTTMGVAADLATKGDEMTESQRQHGAALVAASVIKNLSNKTWLSGVSDLVGAIDDPVRKAGSYARNEAASVAVPAILAQIARASDPYQRDTATTANAIKARVPVMSQRVPARLDVWGQPQGRENLPMGLSAVAPFNVSTPHNDPVTAQLLASGAHINLPSPVIAGVKLSPEQMRAYRIGIGKQSYPTVASLVASPAWQGMTNEEKQDAVSQAMRSVRMQTRGDLGFDWRKSASSPSDAELPPGFQIVPQGFVLDRAASKKRNIPGKLGRE